MEPFFQLLAGGGALGVLSAFTWAWLTGKIRSEPSVKAELAAKQELVDELVASRNDWRTHAQLAVAAEQKLGEALEAQNALAERLAAEVAAAK